MEVADKFSTSEKFSTCIGFGDGTGNGFGFGDGD
jgi:hypothetical protein